MKTLTILMFSIGMAGLTCMPKMVWGQDTITDSKTVVHNHYVEFVGLRDQIRTLKMDMSDVQGKLGATILMAEDREELDRQMAYDMDRLSSLRAAYSIALQYLTFHLYELVPDEQKVVQEAQFYTE